MGGPSSPRALDAEVAKEVAEGRSLVKAIGATSATAPLVELKITRRKVHAEDVSIRIHYAGVCHSDIHTVKGDWGPQKYPLVVGHEIVGIVDAVGANVKGFKVGEKVGVGCMVDSCRSCHCCTKGEEQYCAMGMVGTYGGSFKHDRHNGDFGRRTMGGYSTGIVVDQKFVLRVPESLDFKSVAPLLCAGITVYSPMQHFGLRPNDTFAVAGLGGLGHMAVKFGKAFGCHVTVLSRGETKRADALKLGADAYLNTSNEAELKASAGKFSFLLDTVANQHEIGTYIALTGIDAKIIVVGGSPMLNVQPFGLIMGRRTIAGSLIGGIRETQEMLDLCGRKGIVSDCEMFPPTADAVNKAWERCLDSSLRYRAVIDMTKA